MEENILPENINPEPQPSPEGLIKFEEIKKNFNLKRDNFEAHSMACGSPYNPETMVNINKFHRELEDLMRKYKIVQTVASIFAKL